MNDMNQNHQKTSASEKFIVPECCNPQFMNYQLVGGTITLMIRHVDSGQRSNGELFPKPTHEIKNCNSFWNTEELPTHLRNVNPTFIADRIILSVGFLESRARNFVLEDFWIDFETMIRILRDKGCREMLVTNVPPCATASRRIQYWVVLQSLNAGIKEFCDQNDDLFLCNIFQLFCLPKDFKRRNEYVINGTPNYDVNIELYNVTSDVHNPTYKDLETFSNEGKNVLWQHIKKTIEYRTNQFMMLGTKTHSLIPKFDKNVVSTNCKRSIKGVEVTNVPFLKDPRLRAKISTNCNRFIKGVEITSILFSKDPRLRPKNISPLSSSSTDVLKHPTIAHKPNTINDMGNERNNESPNENSSLKLNYNSLSVEAISANKNCQISDEKLSGTIVFDKTNEKPQRKILFKKKCWADSHKKKLSRHRRKRARMKYPLFTDDEVEILKDFAKYERNTIAYEISKLNFNENCSEVPSPKTCLLETNDHLPTISSSQFIDLAASDSDGSEKKDERCPGILCTSPSQEDHKTEKYPDLLRTDDQLLITSNFQFIDLAASDSDENKKREKKCQENICVSLPCTIPSKKELKNKNDPDFLSHEFFCMCNLCHKWHKEMLHELDELFKELEDCK